MIMTTAKARRLGLALALSLIASATSTAATLDDIEARGRVVCGVETGLAGFAQRDDSGRWSGFEVDFCRAIAAAIFADADAVELKPLEAAARFDALKSGAIDLLARSTTWTFSRDVAMGFEFAGVLFYDGQGFMVPAELAVSSALALDRARICLVTGTTTELNLADFFRANRMTLEPVVVRTSQEAMQKYLGRQCDSITADRSALAALRSQFPDPKAHLLLPPLISKEPLSPAVRQDDAGWAAVVRWTLNALILAEELGVTSANADDMRSASQDPEVRRLLGAEGDLGLQLGLTEDWALNAIARVGNYGELFERHLGPQSQLGLERGLNGLWRDGGLLYALPMR